MSDSDERILTLHPDPAKKGRRIERAKYDMLRSAIVDVLKWGPQTHADLHRAVEQALTGYGFIGSIPWFCETVKLDLEARGLIHRERVGKHFVFSL